MAAEPETGLEDLPETLSTKKAKYQFVKQIGEGSFGNVFLAKIIKIRSAYKSDFKNRSLKIGSQVAIKREEFEASSTEPPQEAIVLEELNAVKGSCLFINCMVDFKTSRRYHYLVLEYVKYSQELRQVGILLDNLYRDDPALWLRYNLMVQMCENVSFLHEVGYFHLDIKPENVIVGESKHFTDDQIVAEWLKTEPDFKKPIGKKQDGWYAENERLFGENDTNLHRYVKLALLTKDLDQRLEMRFVKKLYSTLDVKLIDFGFTKRRGEKDTSFGGTFNFMDPWLFSFIGRISESPLFPDSSLDEEEKQKQLDDLWQNADLWSLGATAYTFFYGRTLVQFYSGFPEERRELAIDYIHNPHVFADLTPEVDEAVWNTMTTQASVTQLVRYSRRLIESRVTRERRKNAIRTSPLRLTEEQVETILAMMRQIKNQENAPRNQTRFYSYFRNVILAQDLGQEHLEFEEALLEPIAALLQIYPQDRANLEFVTSQLRVSLDDWTT